MAEPAGTAPFTFEAPLTVCVDVKRPEAYLALDPVLALAEELDITVDWLPFPVAALKPPPEGDPADRGVRHRQLRARYLEADLTRYAAARGLSLEGIYRDPDTTPASLAMLWLRDAAAHRLPAFLERLFAGYWRGALDVAQLDVLTELLDGIGEPATEFLAFAAGPGSAALASLRERLVSAGVFAVPSLVVEDEVFVGRAHLPMVRWRLTGRAGPPPI